MLNREKKNNSRDRKRIGSKKTFTEGLGNIKTEILGLSHTNDLFKKW